MNCNRLAATRRGALYQSAPLRVAAKRNLFSGPSSSASPRRNLRAGSCRPPARRKPRRSAAAAPSATASTDNPSVPASGSGLLTASTSTTAPVGQRSNRRGRSL
ncbi:MAG TPA: hypothetical protein DDY78_06415 [Planctomycetales bacterium]|nr:hypothetical protein [Planctomycetales bacterium]